MPSLSLGDGGLSSRPRDLYERGTGAGVMLVTEWGLVRGAQRKEGDRKLVLNTGHSQLTLGKA